MRMFLGLLVALPATVWGQAMVEYGLGIAAAGTVGAPGQAASRSVGGIFLNLTKTLQTATESQASPGTSIATTAPKRGSTVTSKPATVAAATTVAVATPTEPPKPAVVYEDPAGIRMGMERAELLGRFGEPGMRVTSGAGRESLTYEAKDHRVEVELRDGKVASVQTKNKPRQSAVVLLQ